jgi:hypothetical protein
MNPGRDKVTDSGPIPSVLDATDEPQGNVNGISFICMKHTINENQYKMNFLKNF